MLRRHATALFSTTVTCGFMGASLLIGAALPAHAAANITDHDAVPVVALTGTSLSPTPDSSEPEHIAEAIQMSWDGLTFAATTSESFLGAPVAVPGDSALRTMIVRNDGPTAGVLRGKITNVQLLAPENADVHHHLDHQAPDDSGLYAGAGPQGNVYDEITVSWVHGYASLSTLLANGDTPIVEIPLERGEQTEVTLSYDYPVTSTAGNRTNVGPRLASFDVAFALGGGTVETPTPTPSSPPPEHPVPSIAPSIGPAPSLSAEADTVQAADLPETGADPAWWLIPIGAVLLLVGVVFLKLSRRRWRHDRF